MGYQEALSDLIKNVRAVVGVVGIGYVGDPLAQRAASAGFKVIGFTRSDARALRVNEKKIPNYTATTDVNNLLKCDIICVCVPTPINDDKTPNLEPLQDSLVKIANNLNPGTLIIIESTVAPGTTRNIALPLLKTSGLKEEEEFFLSFSPERVDPGNEKYNLYNTPRVVSGISDSSLKLSTEFYKSFVKKVVPVSSPEAAEMSKILENTFRLVNISLINELVPYAKSLDLDIHEVVDAAATKPYGFLPHYPGPGVGGHCIPVDPYYLINDARKRGINLSIVEDAGRVNENQPVKVVEKTLEILKATNGHKETPRALLLGLSYKKNIEDYRESASLKIWKLLEEKKISVSYHDPFVASWNGHESYDISNGNIEDFDVIIIATDHGNVDYEKIANHKKPIIDTRKVISKNGHSNIYEI
jgi:UDP-N-acetyl-D-glucosamine dehydrogenase